MYAIKNELLKVAIKHKGAELCSIKPLANYKREFIWQADKTIWGSHAPNLFPIIGFMKNEQYFYDGKAYNMPKHGFVRHNEDFVVKHQSENSITFLLSSSSKLYTLFPFQFEFEITYTLNQNTLEVMHVVKNLDARTMYFSLGGHPAFNCNLYPDDVYTDYVLEFNSEEQSESYVLNMSNGLVTSKTKPVFKDGNRIYLRPDLFNDDALIFKDLKSRKVTLKHKLKGDLLSVKFEDFPYLGIWAKPNATYVCIEPWLGIADSETTNQNIEEKEGIIRLESNTTFEARYCITIEKSHLG